MIEIDLRLLRAGVVVAEELNISRAVSRLRISQPALTKQIQELEDRIGDGSSIGIPKEWSLLRPGVPLDWSECVMDFLSHLVSFGKSTRFFWRRGRGSHAQPGQFRKSQNWIGGSRPDDAAYVPPPPNM